MAGILDWITESAKKQYQKGALYREAVNGLLQGDTSKANAVMDRGIANLRTPEGALETALDWSPLALGTFIGKNSKLWNPAKADLAQQLEKAGASAEDIWRQTGTVRGADKKWRQEISDASSKMIKKPTLDVLKKNPELSTIMQHPELYSAYDDIASAKIVPSYESQGFYQVKDNSIGLSPMNESANWQMKMYKDSKKKTLLHEGQHAIQEKEGFAKGGSPEGMRDVALDMLRRDVASGEIPSTAQAMEMLPMAQQNAYRRLAGEAESRLTEARRDLTPSQRLQYFPYSQGQYGLDVPYESLIVRGLLE